MGLGAKHELASDCQVENRKPLTRSFLDDHGILCIDCKAAITSRTVLRLFLPSLISFMASSMPTNHDRSESRPDFAALHCPS